MQTNLPLVIYVDALKALPSYPIYEYIAYCFNVLSMFGRQSTGSQFNFDSNLFNYISFKPTTNQSVASLSNALFVNPNGELIFKSPAGITSVQSPQKIIIPHYVDSQTFTQNPPSHSTIFFDEGAGLLKFYNVQTQVIKSIQFV